MTKKLTQTEIDKLSDNSKLEKINWLAGVTVGYMGACRPENLTMADVVECIDTLRQIYKLSK